MAASMALRTRSAAPAFRSAAPAPVLRASRLVVRAQANKPQPQLSDLVQPAAVAVIANAIMAFPALADSGKLFDFNLTLPAMVGEFLLLMVFLEKTWFTPVGKVGQLTDGLSGFVVGGAVSGVFHSKVHR